MKIAEVSKLYDISPDTLRYYERVGLLTNVPRNPAGVRDYDDRSCQRIQFVKCMRGAGVSVEALVEYMRLFDQGDSTIEARKALLERQRDLLRERIESLQQGLERLECKIENYEEIMLKAERRMTKTPM